MNQYNFNVLSPLEFEEFSKDILSAQHGKEYQTYSDGKDGGIDLRYLATNRRSEIIIQCKRYKTTSSLMNNLIQKERPKLNKLKPKKYMLVLSLDLSVTQVTKLVDKFKPYIKSSSDIIMPKQLNSYLASHQQVEKRHFKLWLTSSNVLENIIHSGVESYSALTKKNIVESASLFVPIPDMKKAIDKLRGNGFIIITGQPGVGKTTLAKMMAYELIGNKDSGFTEFVSIPRDFNDVLVKLSANPEEHQVFYFDDFLGTNFLDEKLSRREDSVFHELIVSAEKLRKSKALIMTTREYILQQAGKSSRYLDDQKVAHARYVLNLDDYGMELKSRILYNHIANFDIPELHLQFFLDHKVYKKLIKHRNYSPRLVEGIGVYRMWNNTTPEEFCDKLIASFDNPQLLYKHAYENEINNTARDLLLVLMSIGVSVQLSNLYNAARSYNGCSYNAFQNAIDILDGTFIKSDEDKGQVIISFSNPSVHDFLVEYYRERAYTLGDLLEKAIYLNQLIHAFARREPTIRPSKLLGDSIHQFGNMFFDRIIVDEQSAQIIERRISQDRARMSLVKSSGTVEPYLDNLFDRAARLTNEEITSKEITRLVLEDVVNGLLEDKIASADINDVLYIYEYYSSVFEEDQDVLDKLIDVIAASVQTFEDLTSVYESCRNSDNETYIESVISTTSDYGNIDAIIDEEISQRLSDSENTDTILSSISEVAEAYGVTSQDILYRIDERIYPSETDMANFYSQRDDEDREINYKSISSDESVMDDIFESLRS